MKTEVDILHNRMPDYIASFCLSLEEEIRKYLFGRGLKLRFEYDKTWETITVTAIASYVIESLSCSVSDMISGEVISDIRAADFKSHICEHILSKLALAQITNEVPKVS